MNTLKWKQLANNETGFTLVEVMVALVILAFGVLSVAAMSGTVIRTNSQSKNMTTAVTLAQDKLEELKRSALSATLTSADNATETGIDESGNTGGIFTRATTVTGGAAQLTTLQVDITWSDPRSHTITFTTQIRQ